MGLVALLHVGSSQIRDRSHDSSIGRQILNYWTTREAQTILLLLFLFFIFSRHSYTSFLLFFKFI